jgi:hypothetical protein
MNAGEVQQQFNRPTDSGAIRELTAEVGGWQLEVCPARKIAAKGINQLSTAVRV